MRLFLLLFLTISYNTLYAQEKLTLMGTYKGKNIYVANPICDDSNWCTLKVELNGILVNDTIKPGAFEIKLSHLKIGDQIKIEIYHRKDCKPKILNPQMIYIDEFKFKKVIKSKAKLEIETIGEKPLGKFQIFHLENETWIEDIEFKGKGSKILNIYSQPLKIPNTKYKIKYNSPDGKIYISEIVGP